MDKHERGGRKDLPCRCTCISKERQRLNEEGYVCALAEKNAHRHVRARKQEILFRYTTPNATIQVHIGTVASIPHKKTSKTGERGQGAKTDTHKSSPNADENPT